MKKLAVFSIVVALLAFTLPASAGQQYIITGLGLLSGGTTQSGGLFSMAYGLNDAGVVVGSGTGTLIREAILFRNGVASALPVLPTGNPPAGSAFGINLSEQIAGCSQQGSGWEAVIWQNGSIVPLGFLDGSSGPSLAYAINDSGQAVGQSYSLKGYQAFLWQNGVMTGLGFLPGATSATSDANDINNNGQVVGSSTNAQGYTEGFIWRNGVMTGLGDLPGSTFQSWANAVNNIGQVVGASTSAAGSQEAFLWQNGTMVGLGDLPGGGFNSEALDINDAGQVVGWGYGSVGTLEPFIWDAAHGMRALRWAVDPTVYKWKLSGGQSRDCRINNSGQIVGQGLNPQGQWEAFLATPVACVDADNDGDCAFNDCNDANPGVHFGAVEIPNDGIDQDCNGYDLTTVVTRASWSKGSKTLTVTATSALGALANLALTAPSQVSMTWDARKKIWSATVKSVLTNPGTVTVAGIEGSITVPVTATK